MKPVKKQERDTQSRLLESACEIFARKGYRDATLAEICEQACANIAAANYYFRDKETLYTQSWRLSFLRSIETYPPDGGVSPDATLEERLRGRILSVLCRVNDPNSHEFDVLYNELVNPTGLLLEVIRETVDPIRRGLFALVKELLGPNASDLQIQLCQMSIRAQCFDLMMRKRRYQAAPEIRDEFTHPYLDVDIETLADHILRFSLAGIREIRTQINPATDECS